MRSVLHRLTLACWAESGEDQATGTECRTPTCRGSIILASKILGVLVRIIMIMSDYVYIALNTHNAASTTPESRQPEAKQPTEDAHAFKRSHMIAYTFIYRHVGKWTFIGTDRQRGIAKPYLSQRDLSILVADWSEGVRKTCCFRDCSAAESVGKSANTVVMGFQLGFERTKQQSNARSNKKHARMYILCN